MTCPECLTGRHGTPVEFPTVFDFSEPVNFDGFAGGGGLTVGAELAGVPVHVAGNHCNLACRIHAANHPGTIHICQGLLDYDPRQLPPLRWGLFAPSCKDDSPAGQPAKRGTGGNGRVDTARVRVQRDGDRNTAEFVLAVARTKQPERLVVENVPQFTKRPEFGAWLDYLRALGYAIDWRIINALEVGGAVDRPRFILIGQLGSSRVELPSGTGTPGCIGDCLDPDGHKANRWIDCAKDTPRMRALIAKAKSDAGERCFVNNVGDGVRGRPLTDPFPSLTEKSGSQFILIDGARRRVLNTREIARAMGFPEDYIWPTQKGLAGALIGKAIHTRVAQHAIEAAA